MLYLLACLFVVLPQPILGKSSSRLCRGTATLADDGNWYCSQVRAITYKNINQAGKYNRTTGVDADTGLCHHEPTAYSGVGPTTPLIGELSMHLRGPMNVSQLAVYKLPDESVSAQKLMSQPVRRSNYNKYLSKKLEESHKLEPMINTIPVQGNRIPRNQLLYCPRSTITTTLFVTGSTCGQTTSSTTCNTPDPFSPWSSSSPVGATPLIPALPPPVIPPLPSAMPTPSAITTTVHDTTTICPNTTSLSSGVPASEPLISSSVPGSETSFITLNSSEIIGTSTPCETDTNSDAVHTMERAVKREYISKASSSATVGTPPLRVNDGSKAAGDTWVRVAYYTSQAPAEATGFAFTANLGDPQKSGTFDYAFGNSLGYVTGDGSKVATDSTPFDGRLETSEREIAVFSDEICDGDCEYARPHTVAHHGWGGPSKAFLIEFQMDHYDNLGTDQGMLSDAPAWWFLNAAIPRILQYGNDRKNIPCSCWSTGCGEFDAFELLGRGEMRAKSTIHRQGNYEGGDSNYFLRPVGHMLKFAVIFHNWNITATVLDDSFEFSQGLTQAQIDSLIAYDEEDNLHSLFSVGD